MAGNDYIGHQPFDFQWDAKSENFYFRWNKDMDLVAPYYIYNIKQKKLKKVYFEKNPLEPVHGFWQDNPADPVFFKAGRSIYKKENDQSKMIYTSTTNYNVLDVKGSVLLLRQDQNVFALDTEKGSYNQLTHFKEGQSPGKDEPISYLEREEDALFEAVRSNKAKKRAESAFKETLEPDFITPHYLGAWSLGDLAMTPDLKQLVFTQSLRPSNPPTEFMRHITSDGYAKAENARAKVGVENPKNALYVWNLVENELTQVEFTTLTGLNAIPEFHTYYPDKTIEPQPKELVYHLHGANDSGDKCLVEIKSYDNKDRWIGYVDLNTTAFIELNHQHDTAWIGGPGITGWNEVKGTAGWIDNTSYYFQSEESGYSHLYTTNTNTKITKALTQGHFEIHQAQLSKDKSTFYITANKTHLGNRDFYALNIKSGSLTPILTQDGNHDVTLSPDEKWLLVNYSYKNKPWNIYVAPNKTNTQLEPVTHCETEKFKAYPWRAPATITFNANDGKPVNARIYEPSAETKNGAAIFFVHGAGYLQNAHNWWSLYYREYMFNNLLCDMGFTVMDIDYRASEGYGRDFRTAIYRNMGGKDLSDYVDARKLLIDDYGIDSNRVGIYGGSYGGFITLMALLKEPGKFACGAAVRSVTDWAHYNHPYTSNILNTPEEDPIAFKRSSPIYYADNLADKLLMLHGMVDDNVQFQDVVRLSQRFIELGKTNWDLVGYPIEPHGFIETTSWIDEYGRILKLFQEELLEK